MPTSTPLSDVVHRYSLGVAALLLWRWLSGRQFRVTLPVIKQNKGLPAGENQNSRWLVIWSLGRHRDTWLGFQWRGQDKQRWLLRRKTSWFEDTAESVDDWHSQVEQRWRAIAPVQSLASAVLKADCDRHYWVNTYWHRNRLVQVKYTVSFFWTWKLVSCQ